MKPKIRKLLPRAAAVAFWLLAWQAVSMAVRQEILLVSPVRAVRTLVSLMGTGAFYVTVLGSFGRIMLGFFLAFAAGVGGAALAKRFRTVRVLLAPLMSVVKATPVASFVILALIWISSANLSVFIAFLMVLPAMYVNTLSGLDGADPKLLQMAKVFRMGRGGVIRGIYVPAAFPHVLSAVRLSLGMCWKAGIAAEVIAQPRNSIGSALQTAKLFFATDELFAWTLAVIILSVLLEKAVLALIGALLKGAEGSGT